MNKIIAITGIILLIVGGIFAQDETTNEADSTTTNSTDASNVTAEVVLGPHPDAEFSFVFPRSAEKQAVIGQYTPVAVAFRNKGNSVFNVTRIQGSLLHPFDYRYFLQNYTRQFYFENVAALEHRTFVYEFVPDPMFEPRDFSLVVSVFYSDETGANYTNVVYNGTVSFIESTEGGIDPATIFTYIGVVGVAGLVGFFVFNATRNLTKRKGPSRKYETGTQQGVIDNEWLEGTAAMRNSGTKSPKSPRSKPKQS